MVWVDYTQLRRELDIVQVMNDFGVELHGSGEQRKGKCPFEACRDSDTRSLSVNVRKGLWKCWRCHGHGNVIGFTALMQGLDPLDNAQFRKAAIGLQEQYSVASAKNDTSDKRPGHGQNRRDTNDAPQRRRRRATSEGGKPRQDEVVNEPLDFELKELDPEHESIRKLGLSPDTVAYFGLGYCGRRGMFQDRIAIPIHNASGQLVAYAGRIANEAEVDGNNKPFYLYPNRERIRRQDHKKLVFDRTRIVYNAHRVEAPTDTLVVVGDIFHAWIIHDMGRPNVVALLGPVCDEQVASLVDLVAPEGLVWFLTDAGGPLKTLEQLARQRSVRWVCTPDSRALDSNMNQIP